MSTGGPERAARETTGGKRGSTMRSNPCRTWGSSRYRNGSPVPVSVTSGGMSDTSRSRSRSSDDSGSDDRSTAHPAGSHDPG